MKILREKISGFSSVLILCTLFIRTASASNAAAVCAINVAHARPAIPILSFVTIKISRNTLPIDEQIRKYSGILLSPKAAKIPVQILYIIREKRPNI